MRWFINITVLAVGKSVVRLCDFCHSGNDIWYGFFCGWSLSVVDGLYNSTKSIVVELMHVMSTGPAA
jgi:hypothetical protein